MTRSDFLSHFFIFVLQKKIFQIKPKYLVTEDGKERIIPEMFEFTNDVIIFFIYIYR